MKYIPLRGIVVGTSNELGGRGALEEDQAFYNTDTHELIMGPGTAGSHNFGTKSTPANNDTFVLYDSADGGKGKKITYAQLKAALAS